MNECLGTNLSLEQRELRKERKEGRGFCICSFIHDWMEGMNGNGYVQCNLQPSTMYYPFISEEDYTIANLAIRKNFTANMIDAILSTHRHPGSPVTLKNHTMLFDIID